MIGNLEPEESVMNENVIASRKAAAVMKTVSGKLSDVIAALGWDCYDDVTIEIGGTQVSGIHQPENYNKKWAAPYGARKYNKDAFIVIKNRTRSPFDPSQPNPDLVAHHNKPEVATIEVADQKIAIQQDEEAIRAAIKKSDDEKGYDTYSK